eukprot:COSAG05_NODE_6582_length_934_cov_1.741317_2_plen_114_part_00
MMGSTPPWLLVLHPLSRAHGELQAAAVAAAVGRLFCSHPARHGSLRPLLLLLPRIQHASRLSWAVAEVWTVVESGCKLCAGRVIDTQLSRSEVSERQHVLFPQVEWNFSRYVR